MVPGAPAAEVDDRSGTVLVERWNPSDPSVSLRPIESEDAPFLRQLYASTRAAELDITRWTPAERRMFCDSQFDLQDAWYRSTYPHARFDVIEAGGRPVGRLLVATGPDAVDLLDIALTPEERGRGLGSMLVRWIQRRSASDGYPVRLFATPGSRAEHLYLRLGFSVRTDGELHREMGWEAIATGAPALRQFLTLAAGDADLRAVLGDADTDLALAGQTVDFGLARGLAFGPDDVIAVLRENRRAWFERGI